MGRDDRSRIARAIIRVLLFTDRLVTKFKRANLEIMEENKHGPG